MRPSVLSAGIVVVRKESGNYFYLLLRAFHYWDFPKGEVGNTENPFEAAQREVAEEAGIEDLSFPWGHGFAETEPYGKGKVARYYLAETPRKEITLKINSELGRPEHHEFRWLTYLQAKPLLVPRVVKILDWAHSQLEKKGQGLARG